MAHMQQTGANIYVTQYDNIHSATFAFLFLVSQTSCFTICFRQCSISSTHHLPAKVLPVIKEYGVCIKLTRPDFIVGEFVGLSARAACRAPDCPTALAKPGLAKQFLTKNIPETNVKGGEVDRYKGILFLCARVYTEPEAHIRLIAQRTHEAAHDGFVPLCRDDI